MLATSGHPCVGSTAPGSSSVALRATKEDPVTATPAQRSATSLTLALNAHVIRVDPLSPTMRRVVLGGPDLLHLGVTGPTLDLRLRIVVPHRGSTDSTIGACLRDMRPKAVSDIDSFSWYPTWLAHPESLRGVMRTYTVRALTDAADGTQLTLDFVLHTPDEFTPGPASRWALRAEVGDTITVVGPNRALCTTDGANIEWRPGTARTVLMAGDETAVPAALAILETLAAGPDAQLWTGQALLEVPFVEDVLDVTAPPGIRITWLPRVGRARGVLLRAALETAAPLEGAVDAPCVTDIDVDSAALWETSAGDPMDRYAWIAGEAGMLKPLRRWLLGPAGWKKEQVAIMGYWREGRAS